MSLRTTFTLEAKLTSFIIVPCALRAEKGEKEPSSGCKEHLHHVRLQSKLLNKGYLFQHKLRTFSSFKAAGNFELLWYIEQ